MRIRMVRKALGALLIAFAMALIGWFGFGSDDNGNAPAAEKGFVDLSGWDFDKQGNVKLDGDWRFYPNLLLTPQEIEGNAVHPERYIEVPNGWSNKETSSFMKDKGFGTYRLEVKVDSGVSLYGIKTTYIRNASKIYVNGKWVGNSGNPAESVADGYESRNVPYTAYFAPDGDRVVITVQAANLDYYYGGIIQSIYLGTQQSITAQAFKTNLLDTIGISFLLLSAIYYLALCFRRPKDRRFLYITAFCFGYTFVVASSGERIFMQLFPIFPYMSVLKVKFFVMSGGIACLCLFIRAMERTLIPALFNKALVTGMIALLTLGLLVPTEYYGRVEAILVWVYLLILLSLGFFILRAIARKRHGRLSRKTAWQLFAGIILLFLQLSMMTLYLYSFINTNIVPVLAQFFFLLGTAGMFADQYKQAYDELEEMSSKLIETDKLKDEFLIHTSHEFKTPLHGIINLAQVVLDQSGGEVTKKQTENMTYIIAQATRLSTLVNDIIDFQSLQRGSLAFHNTTFDVNGTLQATLEALSPMRRSDQVRLVNRVLPGEHFLLTDENRFKQIVVNLVGNALKFTEQGHVEVAASSQDGLLHLTFADTGTGISEEHRRQLFTGEAFGGGSTPTASAYTSSGLGLKISKIIASQMGGDLALEWSEPGRGTVFRLTLPVAGKAPGRHRADAEPQTSSPRELNAAESQQDLASEQEDTIRILLVDDEASNIKVLRELFSSSRYRLIVASNGEEALKRIEEHRDLSLVLLDVMMPGLSGYEVCQRIRMEYPIYKLPVLLLTVRSSSADIAAGLEAGANDFLAKPFDGKELMARVNTLLQLREAVEQAVRMETLFLQSQIKPHFIYNALSGIMSLCYSDGARAGKLLGEFSNYLRLSFDLEPRYAKVSLGRELSLVKSYIELEKARFGERLKTEMVVDAGLETSIPALIVQPLVENAIRHGLMKRITGGTVVIHAHSHPQGLRIEVRDDGIGMDAGQAALLLSPERAGGGIGLINVHRRLMNEYGQGLRIESVQGEGTTVSMWIPSRAEPDRTSG